MNIKRLHYCDQPHNNWYEYIYSKHELGSPHESKHMFDIYSLTHTFWSLVLVLVLKYILGSDKNLKVGIISILITTFFEIYENLPNQIVKYNRIEIDSDGKSNYRGDSSINIIGDIIFNLIGIYFGLYFGKNMNFIILLLLFLTITKVTGFSYWTNFIEYLFK